MTPAAARKPAKPELRVEMPAQSLEAERVVLGTMLADIEDWSPVDVARAGLTVEEFSHAPHSLLFSVLCELAAAEGAVNSAAAYSHLVKLGRVEEVGGPEELFSLVRWGEWVRSPGDLQEYVDLLRERAEQRRVAVTRDRAIGEVRQRFAAFDREPSADAARELLDAATAVVESDRVPASEEAPTFATLEELLKRPELLRPPECVIPRIGYRGRLVIVAGPDKSGKSTLLSHAAAAVSRRGYFLGEPVSAPHGRAVLLGLEEAVGDAVRRLSDLEAHGAGIQLVVMAPPDILSRTRTLLEKWPADLLVIDSLSEYARVSLGTVPDDGDNAGWATVVRPLVSLAREFDTSVVLIHHVRRSDGQYRGSSEIAAAADALLELVPPATGEDPNLRRVRGRGRWAIEPFALTLTHGRYELAGGEALSLDARVILFVEQNRGASKRAVRDGVGGRASAVDASINTLLGRGALVNRGAGDRMALFPAAAEEPEMDLL